MAAPYQPFYPKPYSSAPFLGLGGLAWVLGSVLAAFGYANSDPNSLTGRTSLDPAFTWGLVGVGIGGVVFLVGVVLAARNIDRNSATLWADAIDYAESESADNE